ncbi:hypothetical protein [Chitinophaga sp. HK235]|nr:hypothetical protein [Chitinophaga sp. HK235]
MVFFMVSIFRQGIKGTLVTAIVKHIPAKIPPLPVKATISPVKSSV